ncbi:CDP-glycerol glycerophosphotransferase family protein [Anaeromyxobacter sp. SG17]|uniref:CDP-glycerol glycerophosphotransferase family protein n=1 Tax=Anaeromyxobacter sp. SG17 TaxID=2925405 RepID=UPI001F58A68F|nr:CDP-glycerol glycerophosphotransferase family protein [Anaeromyxobacter sp. SG17]
MAFFAAKAVTPKKLNRVVLNTFPDYDDTTRAFVEFLEDRRADLVVLVDDDRAAPEWMAQARARCIRKRSAAGIWNYLTAKWVFFTHGCFSYPCLSSRQLVVNLWHGMPFKRIARLDPSQADALIPRCHKTIASSERFRGLMASAFGLGETDVLLADHPRNDLLGAHAEGLANEIGAARKVIAWLPTYRRSVVGDVRIDGDVRQDILSGLVDLAPVDEVLDRHDALCIVKPHPMASYDPDALKVYRRIRVLADDDLRAAGATTYGFLGLADVLISDVSSVVVDWKGTGRPVVLFMGDLEEYSQTRGLLVSPQEVVGGATCRSVKELADELNRILSDPKIRDGCGPGPNGFPRTRALLESIAPQLLEPRTG